MATREQIKEAAETDLFTFARLVNPYRLYGQVHEDVFRWLSGPDAKLDQLVLLPRGHQKSNMMAVWCAWYITNHPHTTILYVSATSDLAMAQLSAIKGILESDIYRKFWPDMIAPDEGKRLQWSAQNIKVDHPQRKAYGVRDATVAARGITANTTGLHSDILVFDDIVVPDNAYTEVGRQGVAAGYSQLSSVLNAGGMTKAVGTRYHGRDIYATMIEAAVDVFSDDGELTGSEPVYEVYERTVEEEGHFLWPREQCPKTRQWHGFDFRVLASIRSKYFAANERAQYYSQYYNDPSDRDSDRVEDEFLYYEPKHLIYDNGEWSIHGKKLSLTAGGDLAYTTKPTSDYTAYAVVGRDTDGFLYILDLVQFKTDKYKVYYEKLRDLCRKWKFRKCKIETNAGANVIVKYIQDQFRKDGIGCAIEGKPSKGENGERTAIVLEPLYHSNSVYHFKGGFMNVYEDQIVLARPANDDLRDAVTLATEISTIPRKRMTDISSVVDLTAHPRFGGAPR